MAARRNLPIVHPGGSAPSTSAPTSSAGAARIVIPGANTNAAAGAASQSAAGAPVQRPTTNSILVNACQKGVLSCYENSIFEADQYGLTTSLLVLSHILGNPVLNKISSTAWEYADIVPDYQVGATTGVLYLSLRYCRLHPEYIHNRIAKLGNAYLLRIMLVQVDVDDHQDTLKDLTKIAIINNLTIVCAWSSQEASRYLEIYKSFERKGPDLIKERKDNDYMSRMNSLLTEVRGINKTDVITLTSHIGSLGDIVNAPPEELLACPGLGEKKVKRMRESFTGSFIVKKRKSNAERRGEEGPDLN